MHRLWMQRIYRCSWSPEEYQTSEAHRQVIPEPTCPRCQKAVNLQRHGAYSRWVISLMGLLLRLWIARFLCPACRHTISYLPEFALTYRPIAVETFEAFLEGKLQRADVRSFLNLLQSYRRRLDGFSKELIRTVGSGLGIPPPPCSSSVWPWIKKAGEGLRPLTRRLVSRFKIGLFLRYVCHQPARL